MAHTRSNLDVAILDVTLKSLDTRVDDLSNDVKKIKEVVIEGTIAEPSLKEQVHRATGWQGNMTRVLWLFVGAAVVQTVTIFFSFIASATMLLVTMTVNKGPILSTIVAILQK